MCKVSIVVPIYHVEQYLPTCIESALAQTLSDIEVILVDDESPDKSPEICDEYASLDSRIRVIHKKNEGVAAARASGLRIAKGKYVFFLDADDCIHPETLQELYRLAEEENAEIVQCDLQVIEEEDRTFCHEIQKKGLHRYSPYDAYRVAEVNDEALGHNSRLSMTVVWGKLIRRDLLTEIGAIEPLRVHEDQWLVTKLLSQIHGMLYLESSYYCYRKRAGSIMSRGWDQSRLIMLEVYRERLRVVSELTNVSDEERRKLKQLVYRRYLIAIFRNYISAGKALQGQEKKEVKKSLLTLFRKERKEHRDIPLSGSDKILFCIFPLCPGLCAAAFSMLKHDK